jgi:hypothetical protein
MAQHVAYLVKCYNIPFELVINTDQTGLHLMPKWGTKTWEEKGTKSVAIIGQGDKRQVTVAVSSSSAGDILPFQVIFTRTTRKSLPLMNKGRKLCENAG